MEITIKSTIILGKVRYTDAEIDAAATYRADIPSFFTPDRQVMAVMNAKVPNVAFVIVDVTESWQEMYSEYGPEYCAREIEKAGGPFAVIELEEDEDGHISWDGSYHVPPTSLERAQAIAIDSARALR